MIERISNTLQILLAFFIFSTMLGYSNPPITDEVENIRAYTRQIEFNYLSWTFDAALLKFQSASINIPSTLNLATQKQIVKEYLRVTQQSFDQEHELEILYADASITDKETASLSLRNNIAAIHVRLAELNPLAEAILQDQVSQVLAELGLTTGGQTVPNVLYHATPLPMALIVSPRGHIQQTTNISLETNLPLNEQSALETRVDKGMNVSSLVVPVGGIGVYPTMVMQTTDLPWMLDTVAHEWTHNYLTFRPLGILYGETPELRTMNETTAAIAGKEIGTLVLQRFYPELINASNPAVKLVSLHPAFPTLGDFSAPAFDFRAEMHTTRVSVDAFLAEGKINEAEAYMEQRRQVFIQNGYLIRKINQAYFAFYGAYADVPGGAAGEDPVGPAVRALRAKSKSLTDFINRISWMTSFDQLKQAQ